MQGLFEIAESGEIRDLQSTLSPIGVIKLRASEYRWNCPVANSMPIIAPSILDVIECCGIETKYDLNAVLHRITVVPSLCHNQSVSCFHFEAKDKRYSFFFLLLWSLISTSITYHTRHVTCHFSSFLNTGAGILFGKVYFLSISISYLFVRGHPFESLSSYRFKTCFPVAQAMPPTGLDEPDHPHRSDCQTRY